MRLRGEETKGRSERKRKGKRKSQEKDRDKRCMCGKKKTNIFEGRR